MKKICYWCGKDMGIKQMDGDEKAVFHSMCDGCADKLNLNERLPEIIWGIAELRKRTLVTTQSLAY